MKELIERTQSGETLVNSNGKQISYCHNTMRYIVGDLKTISIRCAVKEWMDE